MGWWWRAVLMSLSPHVVGIGLNGRARSGGAFPKRAVRRLDENRRLPDRTVGCGGAWARSLRCACVRGRAGGRWGRVGGRGGAWWLVALGVDGVRPGVQRGLEER